MNSSRRHSRRPSGGSAGHNERQWLSPSQPEAVSGPSSTHRSPSSTSTDPATPSSARTNHAESRDEGPPNQSPTPTSFPHSRRLHTQNHATEGIAGPAAASPTGAAGPRVSTGNEAVATSRHHEPTSEPTSAIRSPLLEAERLRTPSGAVPAVAMRQLARHCVGPNGAALSVANLSEGEFLRTCARYGI
mmetsp:Transcript_36317/g.73881  ORF Transcript_36317/g.73881 Transcript_36317/m.73881 type:complete len:189 (+) Transcript_36317:204-770(+)